MVKQSKKVKKHDESNTDNVSSGAKSKESRKNSMEAIESKLTTPLIRLK